MRLGGIFGPMPPKKYEAPIDTTRPIIRNDDKSISTERTITIGVPGGVVIIPTIVGGTQRTPEEAIQLWQGGQNPHVGAFPHEREAEAYALWRSNQIGRIRR